MKYKSNLKQCTKLQACQKALDFIKEKYGDADFSLTDVTAETFIWALWLLYHLDRKLLIDFNCDCAEHVLHFYEDEHPHDNRVRNCIEVTRRWNRGKASDKELKKVRDAAWDAVGAAAWVAWVAVGDAADAAEAAEDAADAADAATGAAACAAERQWQTNRLIELIKTRSMEQNEI